MSSTVGLTSKAICSISAQPVDAALDERYNMLC